MEYSILQFFPAEQREFWKRTAMEQRQIQEIRMRAGRPVIIHKSGREVFLNPQGEFTDRQECAVCMDRRQLEEILRVVCQDSVYAFEEEMRQGFLTLQGGHRIGISGQAVTEADGRLRTIKNIAFLNLRIAHQVKGAADGVLPRLYREGRLMSTLIVSPPGCGKTTLLRDLIRRVSDGNPWGQGMEVAVVDERSEIAGSYLGVPQNDVGMRTDVLDACPKAEGMLLLLRSMSPRVIAIDELGSREELEALSSAAACGCEILATVHGENLAQVCGRFGMERRVLERLFEVFVILGRDGESFVVKQVQEREELCAETFGIDDDYSGLPRTGRLVSGTDYRQGKEPEAVTADIGPFGERNPLWKSHAAGMLPAYRESAGATL